MDADSDKKRDMKALFNRTAPVYGRTGPNVFAHFGERLVELAGIAPGSTVLDVGTGRGAVLFPAARRAGLQGRVIGIDLAEGMLRETAREISDGAWRNVELREMDAETLDFPDASFDYVLCGLSLWFFPRPHTALKEFFRVLKADGKVALSTWEKESPFPGWHVRMLRQYLPPEVAQAPQPSRFETRDELEAALTRAGFRPLRFVSESKVFVYRDDELWWESLWSHGMRRFLEKMDDATLRTVKTDLLDKVSVFRESDGVHTRFGTLNAVAEKPR